MPASMLAITLAAILGCALAQTRPGTNFEACDTMRMANCQAAFNDKLQIDASLDVKTYRQLNNAVRQVWGTDGIKGLLNTCSAFKEYKQCYPSVQAYQNCAANPIGLVLDQNFNATGITKVQAYGYAKMFNQFDFACGAGFSQFANNDVCGSVVFNNMTAQLDACEDSFINYVTTNPEQVCSRVIPAMNCVRSLFYRACNNVLAMNWFGCQYERVGTQTSFPQCTQIFCTENVNFT